MDGLVDEDDPRWCPHFGDGTQKARCSRCNGGEAKEKAKRDAVKREFQAHYDGTCRNCGDQFKAGETILELADGRYVCCRPDT